MPGTGALPEAFFRVGDRWRLLTAAEASEHYAVSVCAVEDEIYGQGLMVTTPPAWQAVAS